MELKSLWALKKVSQIYAKSHQFIPPEQIWQMPANEFSVNRPHDDYHLSKGQRLLARMTVMVQENGDHLHISAAWPRLDAMHVSYRYNQGPWKTMSAGDTLPMKQWSVPHRYPLFAIQQNRGQLDIVVEIAHIGNAFAPFLLQDEPAEITSLTAHVGLVGLVVGIQLMMALSSVFLSVQLRSTRFLSVGVMCLLTAGVLFFGNGVGGMFFATASERFNDQIKFFFNAAWCIAIPWVAAIALDVYQRGRSWRIFSVVWITLWTLLILIWMDYSWRSTVQIALPLVFGLTCVVLAGMLIKYWRLFGPIESFVLIGLFLYPGSLVSRLVSEDSLLSSSFESALWSMLMIASALFLVSGLYMRHRMGRQVLVRAQGSPLLDVLTGLYNREGLRQHMQRNLRPRLPNGQETALFGYITVLESQKALREHGEQGFESGMVQIAAILSSSVLANHALSRVSGHGFAFTAILPSDPEQAVGLAQKVLTRLIVLQERGVALAGTAQIALAWLPLEKVNLDKLERHCLRAIDKLDSGRKIVWATSQQSPLLAKQAADSDQVRFQFPLAAAAQSKPPDSDLNSDILVHRIANIEQEMLSDFDADNVAKQTSWSDSSRPHNNAAQT